MKHDTRPHRAHSKTAEIICVILFVSVMAAANLSIAYFGPWFLPVTAFVSVGISMVARDYLNDIWSELPGGFWLRMFSMIVAAALLSFAVDSSAGTVALASVCAITGSAIIETLIFMSVIRFNWLIRSNASSFTGAVADSMIFPLVAFGYGNVDGFWLLVLTQTATKSFGGFFWSLVFRWTINPDKKRKLRAQARARIAGETIADHLADHHSGAKSNV